MLNNRITKFIAIVRGCWAISTKGWVAVPPDREAMITYSSETVDFARELADEIAQYNIRFFKSAEDENERERDDYQRDYARVLYSSSFRRLQGKMQLLGIDHAHFHRNRLTHSLEVAQIARTVAAGLGVQGHIVTETCSLAHDLGNPPFGHCGEGVLNALAVNFGGFEGNAQTFRIINFLEKKSHTYRGLNLTFRTLMGVVKYFTPRGPGRKKGSSAESVITHRFWQFAKCVI